MRPLFLIGGLLSIVAGIFAYLSLFQVSEIEHAIVLQFGEPIEVISEPGLKYKHFWQDARFYEKRVLNLDPPVETILLADQKRILVNAFTRYRIVDPLRFFQSVRIESTLRALRGGDLLALAQATRPAGAALSEEDAAEAERRFLSPAGRAYWGRIAAAVQRGAWSVVEEEPERVRLRVEVGGAAGAYLLELRRRGERWYLAG